LISGPKHQLSTLLDLPAAQTMAQPPTAVASSSLAAQPSLVIYNISKRANVRQLLCVAVAFGCRSIYLIGHPQFRVSRRYGTYHASEDGYDQECSDDLEDDDVPPSIRNYLLNLSILRFRKWTEFMGFCRQRKSLCLVGVEIHDMSIPVNNDFPINLLKRLSLQTASRGTNNDDIEPQCPVLEVAFLLGNEGTGLFPRQMEDCKALVRIPQYGAGTASLNVAVAASIILQQFHAWQTEQT
jgi:tRNA(Leu) C34 or U34 (ribose-2'-O)-methylase TrmL